MYLDDDDYLAENDSIMKIFDSLSEDAILIWRVSNGKQIYPSNKNFNTKGISYCDFTSNCFMYHSKWLKINKQLVWPGVKGGDYRFGLKLYKTIKKINLLSKSSKLSEKLRQIRPGLPIIICSGHSSIIDEERAKAIGISAYAMKPISMSQIATIIRSVFDG